MNPSDELRGIWQATAAIVNGEAMPASAVQSIRLVLTATRFTTSRGSQTLFDSSYSVDVSKCPNEIEMIGIGDFEGRPALGIFTVQGDALELCYTMPGFLRPAEFASAVGSGAFLITLKRLAE